MKKIIIIGYSGHSYVACDIFLSNDRTILGYCDKEEKNSNPFKLSYLGDENILQLDEDFEVFVAIGNNIIRQKVASQFLKNLSNAIHPNAVISKSVKLSSGIMISPNATINALANIGTGVIVNTGAIIEHECRVGDFSHIAPGAVLLGDVSVDFGCMIGANSVIMPGVKIGDSVTVGAGAVILNNIPNGATVVGNPGRIIKK